MNILTFILLFIIFNLCAYICAYIFLIRDGIKMYRNLWNSTSEQNTKMFKFIVNELNREQEWRNSLDD